MPLTDTAAKQAKAKEKSYKLADSRGLFLLVNTTGAKYWRLKYRFAGKEKLLALGVYPEVTLAEARRSAEAARSQRKAGVDPGQTRKERKSLLLDAAANTFQAVGDEWFLKQAGGWAPKHADKVRWILDKNLYPWLGQRPAAEITPPELLSVLRRIEHRGKLETAKRTRQVAGQVFRYAVATGRALRDPSQDLRGALAVPQVKHLAAVIEPKDVGPLLIALEGYIGTPGVCAALRLSPMLFVRPGELRHARWAEMNLAACEWRIPGSRMKMKQDHIVPLCRQAVGILRDLQPTTGQSEYVFPSARSPRRPMSDNAVLAAMRRMGIGKEETCGHGFRAMARTIMDEVLGYRVDWIEHQLAHAVKDVNGRAYNRTAHLAGRKQMMQGWADYLDTLRVQASGGNVVPIKREVA